MANGVVQHGSSVHISELLHPTWNQCPFSYLHRRVFALQLFRRSSPSLPPLNFAYETKENAPVSNKSPSRASRRWHLIRKAVLKVLELGQCRWTTNSTVNLWTKVKPYLGLYQYTVEWHPKTLVGAIHWHCCRPRRTREATPSLSLS